MIEQTINKYLITPPPQVDLNFLPDRLKSKLLPFQREGVNFAVSKNGRCLIADEMGLGKTLQAIAVACYYKTEWPLLILLPASLKYQWVEELEKWLPELLPSDINIINNSSDVGNITKCKISIASYSLLRYGNPNTSVLFKAIKAQKFKVTICDESHNIKNKKSKTANIVVELVQNSIRCVLLSGTPAVNKPSELFTQLDAILPGRFGTFNEYTLRYCNAHYVYFGRSKIWNIDGATNLVELEMKLKQHLMIRRLKKDVLSQLPPKRRQKVPFDLKFDSNSSELQKELTAMQEELERLLSASNVGVAQILQPSQGAPPRPGFGEIRQLITQLYLKTCHAKIGPVVEFVLFYTSGDDSTKVLVFAHHQAMINSIQEALWNANIKHIRIDGNVPTNERNLLVKQFQSDPQIKVAILSILAAGSGLTLTAASVVVFAELWWTPSILMQCEDRAHRIGQTAQSVNIYYLVARGTIDERVWSMVDRKTRVLAMALDGQKKGLSATKSNQYISNILSNVEISATTDIDNPVEEDVDVEDFFTLADLKCQNQPTLVNFLSQDRQQQTTSKKRPKRLVLRPAEVVDIMNADSDAEEGVLSTGKKARMSDDQFMDWALKDNNSPGNQSPSSLPSLRSSPAQSCDDSDSVELIDLDSDTADITVPSATTHNPLAVNTAPANSIADTPTSAVIENIDNTIKSKCEEPDTNSDITTASAPSCPVADGSASLTTDLSEETDCYTKLQNNIRYSPVALPSSGGDSSAVDKAEKYNDLIEEANFNIIPGRAGNCSGSDVSGDLFSDASFEDLMMDESPQGQSGSRPVVDKAEEARVAAELLGDDDDIEENGEYWTCVCQAVNDRELDCCLKCAFPRMPSTWICNKCGTVNKLSADSCDECLSERDSVEEVEERLVDFTAIPVYTMFYFLVSHHTNRIFLHDKDGNYLKSSFHAVDLDNEDLLPDLLLRPENLELAKQFVSKWNRLKKREQKVLVKKKELIDCPERAYFGGKLKKMRKTHKERYKSKSDVAGEAAQVCEDNPGAQTRTIIRETRSETELSERPGAGYVQVMSADNKPLCITCHTEYESDLLSTSFVGQEKNGWQTRFCSPECADTFWMKTHTSYIRQTTKSMDAGVCEECGVNCNEIFRKIKNSRSLKARAEMLQQSRYSALSAHVKVTMVKNPAEGQFWHVDHILPVYAGGGQCDIDNLRTLCTPCHQTVTSAQAGHRARMRASIGNKTITDFFSPGTKDKLKAYD